MTVRVRVVSDVRRENEPVQIHGPRRQVVLDRTSYVAAERVNLTVTGRDQCVLIVYVRHSIA